MVSSHFIDNRINYTQDIEDLKKHPERKKTLLNIRFRKCFELYIRGKRVLDINKLFLEKEVK